MSDFVISVKIGTKLFDDIEQGFDALAAANEEAIGRTSRPLSQAMRYALQRVAKALEKRHSKPWNGAVKQNTPDLQSRTGRSIKTIAKSIHVTGGGQTSEEIIGQISTAGVYAIHETGGHIRARTARYLTIPLPSAMDSRGVPLRKRARDWDRTFVAASRHGNLLIFRKEASGKVTPLYLLKTQVYIPPRLGLYDTILTDALPYFDKRALDIVSAALEKAL